MAAELERWNEGVEPRILARLNWLAGGALATSILLWSVPPFFLSKQNAVHRWIQGLCLAGAIAAGVTTLAAGYRLRHLEPRWRVRRQQEEEDFLHDMATRRYYWETLREATVEEALQEMLSGAIEPQPALRGNSEPPAEPVLQQPFRPPEPVPVEVERIFQTAEAEPKKRGIDLEKKPQIPDRGDPRVQELWERIEGPHYDWLAQLLLTKPLLVWGEQCSGKTKFTGFLALLRVLFFRHEVSVSDPHSHQNSWPASFAVYGREYDYAQVNARLAAYYQRLKTAKTPHTSIWDEVTQYQENCDPQLAGRFLKSILSDVRKPPEFPILLSHSNTLGSLGGGKGGIKKMQVRGLVEVNLRAKRDRLGNLFPALKGTVTGLNFDEEGKPVKRAIALEEWMQPEPLLETFPELENLS